MLPPPPPIRFHILGKPLKSLTETLEKPIITSLELCSYWFALVHKFSWFFESNSNFLSNFLEILLISRSTELVGYFQSISREAWRGVALFRVRNRQTRSYFLLAMFTKCLHEIIQPLTSNQSEIQSKYNFLQKDTWRKHEWI